MGRKQSKQSLTIKSCVVSQLMFLASCGQLSPTWCNLFNSLFTVKLTNTNMGVWNFNSDRKWNQQTKNIRHITKTTWKNGHTERYDDCTFKNVNLYMWCYCFTFMNSFRRCFTSFTRVLISRENPWNVVTFIFKTPLKVKTVSIQQRKIFL